MRNPTTEFIRGIVETTVLEYQVNYTNKEVNEIEVEEWGLHDFRVKIWFPISESQQNDDLFIVSPDHDIAEVRRLTLVNMESIIHFVKSVQP